MKLNSPQQHCNLYSSDRNGHHIIYTLYYIHQGKKPTISSVTLPIAADGRAHSIFPASIELEFVLVSE